MSSEEIQNILRKIDSLITDITPLYILSDGIYFESENKALSNRILIFLHEKPALKYLTGPINITNFSRLLFDYTGLANILKRYIEAIENKIKSLLSREFTINTLKYIDFAKLFLRVSNMLGVNPRESLSIEKLGFDSKKIDELRRIIIEEHSKSKDFTEKWNPKKSFLPNRDHMRLLDINTGITEFSSVEIDAEKVKVYPKTAKRLFDIEQTKRILLFLTYWYLEKKKLVELEQLAKNLDEILVSSDQLAVLIAKKLENEKKVYIPVEVDNIQTYIGLRKYYNEIYITINTGEYIVKEVLNPLYTSRSEPTYIYFSPIDICVELKLERKGDRNMIYPAEAPVMIDRYLHPSVPKALGKRTICLGDMNDYVAKIIEAAKDVARTGKPIKIEPYGYIVSSVEQALVEILVTAFRVLRYGYKRGARPHKYASECVGSWGVKIVVGAELERLKDRGIEIVN